jgi:hypothetical protein
MKLSFVFLFVWMIIGLQNSYSQVDKTSYPDRQIGVALSTLAGGGFSYLDYDIFGLGPNHAFRWVGIFIYNDANEKTNSFFSLGGEYQKTMMWKESARAYFLVGAHVDNQMSSQTFFGGDYKNDTFFSTGVGFGYDAGKILSPGLIFNFNVSYQLTTGFGAETRTRVGFGGGIGLGYNF